MNHPTLQKIVTTEHLTANARKTLQVYNISRGKSPPLPMPAGAHVCVQICWSSAGNTFWSLFCTHCSVLLLERT